MPCLLMSHMGRQTDWEVHTRTDTSRHIWATHRCVSKMQDIEHITVQYITFRMNWPCVGKLVHQSSVKAAVFSTGSKTRWKTAGITAWDTGCYHSSFLLLIHVHQPVASSTDSHAPTSCLHLQTISFQSNQILIKPHPWNPNQIKY